MNKDNKNPIELKLILLGPSAVGKTSFATRYILKHYKEDPGTIGASFFLKIWNSHKIAIWDTSGEEKYRSLSRYYCRGAGAVVMAFDLSKEQSFSQLEQEFVPLLEHTLETRVVAVVGMKMDLVPSGTELFRARAIQLLTLLNQRHPPEGLYFETSSLVGSNVEGVFEALFKAAFLNPSYLPHTSSKITLSSMQPHKQCSC